MIHDDNGNPWTPGLPPGGNGRLAALLESLKEDKQKMHQNPFYQEGYADGRNEAVENYQRILKALHSLYNVDGDLM